MKLKKEDLVDENLLQEENDKFFCEVLGIDTSDPVLVQEISTSMHEVSDDLWKKIQREYDKKSIFIKGDV